MKQISIHVLLILVIAGGIFFTNLGRAKLWDRDEPRNAGCAVEMLSRGNYVVPTFNGELRYQKPALQYWLMISAFKVFGINEFAARFWSALLAIGTVLATYAIGRRLFHPTAALLSAVILSTTLMFDVAARAATPDSILIFCSTNALLIYVLGTFAPQANGDGNGDGNATNGINLRNPGQWFPTSFWVNLAMYSMMAFGVLAKGPVGIILPMAIIGMFLLIKRQQQPDGNFWKAQGWLSKIILGILRPFNPVHFFKTFWSMRPLIAALAVLVIAAPWYVLVGIQTDGDFLSSFLIGEHFGRATTVLEDHGGSWWFYPLAILLGFFPWSVFWFPTLLGVDRNLTSGNRTAPATLFLLCWAGVQVALFSLASTKLPSYVTPCYPALAMLVGALLYDWVTEKSPVAKTWFLAAYGGLIVGGVILTAGLGFVTWKILDGDHWLTALGAIPIAGGIVALALAWNGRARDSVFAMVTCSVVVCLGLFGFGAMTLSNYQQHDIVLGHVFGTEPDVKIASYRTIESSWVVYSQKPVYELAVETQPVIDELNVSFGNGPALNTELTADPTDSAGGVTSYLDRFADSYRSKGNLRNNSLDPRGAIVAEPTAEAEQEKWWKIERRLTPEEFVEANPRAAFLTSDEYLDELLSRLPADYQVIESTGYFLQNKHLVLLARRDSEIARNAYQQAYEAANQPGFPEDAAAPEFTAETGAPLENQNTRPPQWR